MDNSFQMSPHWTVGEGGGVDDEYDYQVCVDLYTGLITIFTCFNQRLCSHAHPCYLLFFYYIYFYSFLLSKVHQIVQSHSPLEQFARLAVEPKTCQVTRHDL